MKVLVAGATGVIGRALLPLLESAGHDVVGLSRAARPGPGRSSSSMRWTGPRCRP